MWILIPSLTNDELSSILNKIKANLTKEGCWDTEITSDLPKVTSDENLFKAASTIYQRFCKKGNQDSIVTEFYELIPKSTALDLEMQKPTTLYLVMISIPDHLVALFTSYCEKQKPCPPIESKSKTNNSIKRTWTWTIILYRWLRIGKVTKSVLKQTKWRSPGFVTEHETS